MQLNAKETQIKFAAAKSGTCYNQEVWHEGITKKDYIKNHIKNYLVAMVTG